MKRTITMIGSFVALAVASACGSPGPKLTPSPISTPTALASPSQTPDSPVRNPAQRLARAAEVREYFKSHEIPANVIADDLTLKIYYQRASADYMQAIFDTFCSQQGTGISGLILSGFETVEIHADDSFGKEQHRAFPLTDCKPRS